MGVFQVRDGIDTLFNLSGTGLGLTTIEFLCFVPPIFHPW